MSSQAMDRAESAPVSTAASSSAIPLQPRKAVMLKGPSLTSKTYFVPLPDTLDQLVARAVQLFSLPPGKVPHITIGADERAIIMDESYEFIRDRELVNFRWSAETPRRNLANRVRWTQTASSTTSPFPPTASPQNTASSSDEVAVTCSVIKAADALKAQVQGSPVSESDIASKTRANTIANRDPNTLPGLGAAARKAHATRVLAQQQRKQEEEHEADLLGAAPVITDADQEVIVDADPEATAQAALELAATSSPVDPIQEQVVVSAATEQTGSTAVHNVHASTLADSGEAEAPPSIRIATPEVVSAPAQAAVTIDSPPRKKHVDNGGLDTPPSSGSRSNSPFHSSELSLSTNNALDHRMRVGADDETSSSPMSSPTRDVSSRHRNALPAMPMRELGKISTTKSNESATEESQAEAPSSSTTIVSEARTDTVSEPSETVQQDVMLASEEPSSLAQDDVQMTPASAVSKPSKPASDLELTRIYSFLSNLISQLLSHKSNFAFQRPISVEFEQFASRSSRPVDLFTIRDSLALRKYGSQHLEGRMAANAVVTEFEDDLNLLYTNARRFFGVRSTQAECVEHLEKFSRSFLNEWKRAQGSAAQTKPVSDAAAGRTSRSPGPRGEKHSFMSPPFAALLPSGSTGNTGAAGSVGRKSVGLSGISTMMRRPDFAFKRNASYETSLTAGKRPVQATTTTSEAFERALRAATSTPQADRIKPRQEVVAFATRSVIETDFMARPPPQQEVSPTAALVTPSTVSNKRKRVELTLDNTSGSRSPSVSPPPSPSPTKRRLPVAKSSKHVNRRQNKKKARQAAAAAAAAAAAVKLTESKRKKRNSQEEIEEQVVVELITSPMESPAKRTRAARSASISADRDFSAPLPVTPGGRTLRSSKVAEERQETSQAVKTSGIFKGGKAGSKAAAELCSHEKEVIDIDGFEVTGSRRRSSRPRKPVNFD